MEKVAYGILILLAIIWIGAILVGLITAMPFGLLGLFGLLACGLLFVKVVRDRLASKEDDYYAKNVEK